MKKPQHKGRDKKEQKPEAATDTKQSQYKQVYVMRSKCGYEGEGELIGPAYGDKFLVKIDRPGFNKLITVKKTDIK